MSVVFISFLIKSCLFHNVIKAACGEWTPQCLEVLCIVPFLAGVPLRPHPFAQPIMGVVRKLVCHTNRFHCECWNRKSNGQKKKMVSKTKAAAVLKTLAAVGQKQWNTCTQAKNVQMQDFSLYSLSLVLCLTAQRLHVTSKVKYAHSPTPHCASLSPLAESRRLFPLLLPGRGVAGQEHAVRAWQGRWCWTKATGVW